MVEETQPRKIVIEEYISAIFSTIYRVLLKPNDAAFVDRTLQYILITTLVLNISALGLVATFGDMVGVIMYSILIPIFIFCIYLLRQGKSDIVKFIFIYGIFTIGLYRASVTLGVHAPMYIALTILVLLATIIYQAETGMVLALIAIFCGFLMMNAESIRAQVTGAPWVSATNMWGAMANIFFIAAAIGYFLRRTTDTALETAKEKEQALVAYNKKLEEEIKQRQQVEKDLVRTQSLYRSIVQDQPNFVVRWQPDGTIIFANDVYCDYHQKTRDEMLGANFFTWSPTEVKQSMQSKLAMMSPDNAVITSIHPITEDEDNSGWHQWIDRGIFNDEGELVMIQSVGLDITARKQLDENLVKLRVAEAREAFLEEFLSTMTHDLKTPLSVVSTSVYLAGRAQDKEVQSAQLEKINSQIKALTKIINNILSVTRLRNIPELKLASVAVHPIIEQIHSQLITKASVKNITFKMDLSPENVVMMADAEQLERILLNLMDNALNYTPDNEKVTVQTRTDEETLSIIVADTGIGIPEKDLPNIFTQFYRAANAKDIEGGTGLGLAIVKRIVELHHGEITIDSTVNVGTTFTLTFPRTL